MNTFITENNRVINLDQLEEIVFPNDKIGEINGYLVFSGNRRVKLSRNDSIKIAKIFDLSFEGMDSFKVKKEKKDGI